MRLREGSLVDHIGLLVERIADMRSKAADGPRDTYTVVLGQMLQLGLVEESVYSEAMDRPRTGVNA